MNNEDFNLAGKRMPYAVPDGYFEQAVACAEAIGERKIKRQRPWLWGISIGVCSALAAVLVIFICNMYLFPAPPMEQYQNFIAQMSEDDLANACADVEYMVW